MKRSVLIDALNEHESDVVFFPKEHEYYLGMTQLTGLTSILKSVLFADKYDGIPKDVLQRAADRGTLIHEAAETYLLEHAERSSGWTDEQAEAVRALKAAREGSPLSVVRAEYLISDRKDVATQIDLVSHHSMNGTVVLEDIKTTRELDREYLSWQLSAEAYIFERQTGVRVDTLQADWYDRDGRWTFHDIERRGDDQIEALFADWQNGVVRGRPDLPAQIVNLGMVIADLQRRIAEPQAQLERMKAELMSAMKEHGVMSMEVEGLKASYTPAHSARRFDSKRFKSEHADMYAEYESESEVKDSIRLTLR